jgi:hypothetical protein
VPVERFDAFVAAVKALGELITADVNSQEVTEEYYDLEANIRNKTREEERLLTLLEERPGKLEDVIAVERELARVRGEIERLQGRLRYLANRTSLASVELVVTEVRPYRPDQTATFATRVRRGFGGSLSALQSVGELVGVGLVVLAPWFAAFALIAGSAYALLRPILRRATIPKDTAPSPQ